MKNLERLEGNPFPNQNNCWHLIPLEKNQFLNQMVKTHQLRCDLDLFCDQRIPFTQDNINRQNIGCIYSENILLCPIIQREQKKIKNL